MPHPHSSAKSPTDSSRVSPNSTIFGGMSLAKLEGFCKRMSTGLAAGLDILKLINIEKKYGDAKYRTAMQKLHDEIANGESLSQAMAKQYPYFPRLLVRLSSVGEHAGRLEHTFSQLADHYSQLRSSRTLFLQQLTVPLLSLIVGFAAISLLIFVNGFMKSGTTYDEPFDLTGFNLRGASGVLIFWSISAFLAFVLATIGVGIWKNWFNAHRVLYPIAQRIPVLGQYFSDSAMSRLSSTLSMLLGAGVDAKRSVRESILATGNHYYTDGLQAAEAQIAQGNSLAEAFQASGRFPEDFVQTIEVGELSGSDSESLERQASIYLEKANASLKKLAIVTGMIIWLGIAIMIIIAIFTIFGQIMQIYSNALKM